MTSELRRSVPISRPRIEEAEVAAVVEVLRSGNLAQGPVVAKFEAAFADYVGAEYGIATSSGTTALHVALLAHGVGPGDEVITTPFSFIATANAILYVGATPVFADVDPETLNLSPEAVKAKLTKRTKAVVPVDLYGNPCAMGELVSLAEEHGLALIDDACQAHGAEYEGRRIGSFGTACFSFYPTKNLTCGEGGMVTTSDPAVAERAKLARAHGMKMRYLHEQLGYNFRMTDIHAAIGLAQLPRLAEMNARRAANAAFYDIAFADLRRPKVSPNARSAWHQYTLLVDPAARERLAAELPARGVGVGIYYPIPIHRQPVYTELGMTADCPVAEAVSQRVISIPVHPGVSEEDRAYVVQEVRHVLDGA